MLKRTFDIALSFFMLLFFSWFLLLLWLVAAIDTGSGGIFRQTRIGRFAKPFTIFKFRTMHPETKAISSVGRFLRDSKLDELLQLANVFIGDMSFVGPRPDIPGYYDKLEGEDRKILNLRPGLTSEASLKYFNEEALLASKENPDDYNDNVIFPDKVRLNFEYYRNRSFWRDVKIIWRTVFARGQ